MGTQRDVANIYVKLGEHDRALALVRSIGEERHRFEVNAALTVAFVNAGREDLAEATAAEAVRLFDGDRRALPELGMALAAIGDIKRTREILDEIGERRDPFGSGRATVVIGLAAGRSYDLALEIARKLQQARSTAMTAVARALAKEGRREDALRILRETVEATMQPGYFVLAEMAAAFGELGDVETAVSLADRARELGKDEAGGEYRLCSVAKLYATFGKAERARGIVAKVLADLEPVWQSDGVRVKAVEVLALAGDWEPALAVAETISGSQQRAHALVALSGAPENVERPLPQDLCSPPRDGSGPATNRDETGRRNPDP